jgi:hypothetical protein
MLLALVLEFLCGCAAGSAAKEAQDPSGGYAVAQTGTTGDMPPPPMAPAEEADEDSGGGILEGAIDKLTPNRSMDARTAAAGPGAAPPPAPAPAPQAPEAKPDELSKRRAAMAGDKVAPLLIYRATFHMGVFEAAKSIDHVQKLAVDMGGYLVKRDQNSIIIRVPAEKYKTALEGVTKLGDVLHREETVEDVTEQFHDLMTRLRNARAMRDRLEELLAKAKDVKEALAVEQELGRITAEIESMEGKLKLLRELISFSTITVLFQPRGTDNVSSNVRLPFSWLDQMGLPSLLDLGVAQ